MRKKQESSYTSFSPSSKRDQEQKDFGDLQKARWEATMLIRHNKWDTMNLCVTCDRDL